MSVKNQGFTLLELSIVLVIIGLIVGGLTVGSEMIKQAELGKVQKDINEYTTAVNTFKLKYSRLPGDMINAVTYWGAGTANGDGNGRIDTVAEGARAWQHANSAGVVPGSWPGTGTALTPGTNIPNSSVDGAGISMFYHVAAGNASTMGNGFILGTTLATSANLNAAVTAADAASIDTKMDDGLAASGLTRTIKGSAAGATTCVTAGTTGTYNLSETAINCTMFFDGISN